MTISRNCKTWLAAMVAVVFVWTVPAWADEHGGRGKKDWALQQLLRSDHDQPEYRVIIETVDHGAASADAAIRMVGGHKLRHLTSFTGDVVVVTEKQLERLERHPLVTAIYLDRPTQGLLERTNVTIGVPTVRSTWGYTGKGVGVAVIDSGVTGWHDDLTGQGLNQRVSAFVDFVGGQWSAHDDYGHGTHVAGIIAGNGYDSSGRHSGIAPAAKIAALKVLDGEGAGYMSDVIAAIDWTIANRSTYDLRVVNLSVGAPVTQSYHADPLTLATRRAVESGLVVVAASGNRGRNADGQIQYGGITAPGNAPWVITVGNASTEGTTDRSDDVVAPSSSRGPTWIDFSAKPDLVAPGTGVVSLSTAGSALALRYPSALVAGTLQTAFPPYLSLTGSSMAAPVVSGTVALMLEANPSLTPNAVKAILQYTAESKPDVSALAQGAGFLNTYGAVRLAKYFKNPGGDYPTGAQWSRTILWGNYRVSGGKVFASASAFATNIVWGTLGRDNIVWGTILRDGYNIVWGTLSADNIVWGTLNGDNIVWGTVAQGDNIVWGTDCGGADCFNIVWGTAVADADNIVWGTAARDNIVWGTAAPGDNIVWGTAARDNIVWGTADNIVWGTAARDNIVWGTSDEVENIVWGTDVIDDEPFEEALEPGAAEDGAVGTVGTVGGGL